MLNYASYPVPYMVEGVRNYLEHGVPPGDFLAAIITNDLREACACADETNQRLIFETVAWFWNEAPSAAWGSKINFKLWCRTRQQEPFRDAYPELEIYT